MLRISAMIQARLGSKRLPGKVLLPFDNTTLLGRILIQLKASKYINAPICLSTSNDPKDDQLQNWAEQNSILCDRQNVDDIIGRISNAAEKADADIIVRIWGDCPFVAPDLIDDMIEDFLHRKLDYLCNSNLGVDTFPGGLDIEIYSRNLLRKMNVDVTEFSLREFPVEYVRKSDIKSGTYSAEENLSHLHLTVDYPEDLAAAQKLLKQLSPDSAPVTYRKIFDSFLQSPDIFSGFSEQPRNIEYKQFKEQLEE